MAEKAKEQRIAIPPRQFREKIVRIKRDIGNLITLAAHIARDGSVTVALPGRKEATTFGAQAIKSFRSQINKNLDSLASEYAIASRGKRVRRAAKKETLPNLSMITESFRKFWENANLGPLNPEEYTLEGIKNKDFPEQNSVAAKLNKLTREGITSSSLLQSAWATYIDVNGLKIPEDPKYLSVANDKYLQYHLGPALDWLENNTPTREMIARYDEKQKQGVSRAEKPEKFDRNRFKRYWLATIGSLYTVPRPGNNPTPQQLAVGNDTPMSAELEKHIRSQEVRGDVQNEILLLKDVRDRWNKKLGTGKYSPKKTGRKGVPVQEVPEEEIEEEMGEETGEEIEEEIEEETGEETGEEIEEETGEGFSEGEM